MHGLSVFLLLAFNLLVNAEDEFVFDVEFTCGYHQREKFNYNLQFFEHDSISPNDPITDQRIGEGRTDFAKFSMSGSQDGDGWFSSGYDVRMTLYHDCTEYNKEVEANVVIEPSCPVGKKLCHYVIKKDIKDFEGDSTLTASLLHE